jgi:hypothetical protein
MPTTGAEPAAASWQRDGYGVSTDTGRIGVYRGPAQVGLARVVTDRAPFGFKPMSDPLRYLEIHRPEAYP